MKLFRPKWVVGIIVTICCSILAITNTNAQWSYLDENNDSIINRTIVCLTTNYKGDLYAAGRFTNSYDKYFVAQWNGRAWGELGGSNISTFKNRIYDIMTDAKGNLYTVFYNYIAKWDGTKWSRLGINNDSTFNNFIKCINTDKVGNLYASGNFRNSNGKYYVAKWDGSSWCEVGGKDSSTFNGPINSIVFDAKGKLYIGGEFSNSFNMPIDSYYIAYWNGKAWSNLNGINDSLISGAVYKMAMDKNDNLYVAGLFYNPKHMMYISKWDGTTWNKINCSDDTTFTAIQIQTILIDTNSNLYASAGFENENYDIIKWNGESWSNLGVNNGNTINNHLFSITTDANGNVYAVGPFINNRGKHYLARYTPTGLPINLADIIVIKQGKTIQTAWRTSTELNTSHFIIQRSTDGSSFTDIGTVKAIGSGANGYSFIDTHPNNGINYYRLESVDKDGSSSYSKVVSIQLTVDRLPFTVVPNPARDIVTVKGNHIASVQVIDNLGRVVKTFSLKDATNPMLSVGGLPAGMYHLQVQTTDGKVSGVGMVVN